MKSLIRGRPSSIQIPNPTALGEIQQNQQDQAASRLPHMPHDGRPQQQPPPPPPYNSSMTNGDASMPPPSPRGRSPTKSAFSTLSLRAMANGVVSREPSPTKPKKSKSGTNLGGFLTKPKSLKNLHKLLTEEIDQTRSGRDKENTSPAGEQTDPSILTPIYSQFKRDSPFSSRPGSMEVTRAPQPTAPEKPPLKQRPRSFHPLYNPPSTTRSSADVPSGPPSPLRWQDKMPTWDRSPTKPQRLKIPAAFGHSRSKSHDPLEGQLGQAGQRQHPQQKEVQHPQQQAHIDPKDIDAHFEAMLNRRNIPENQRYKMRNLNNTVKMEFIRQDWAEMQAAKTSSPTTSAPDDEGAASRPSVENQEDPKSKRSRGRSFTLSRGKGSGGKKSKGEGTLGRHFRTRSTDSITSAGGRTISGASTSSESGIMSKISKLGQGPRDYVAYLRKQKKAEDVEVGKLHKLRLLLRNETVSWIEEFIQQGGMKGIVDLLNRIMELEWREEHEDALLHETLLCLKALSTTALALQYIHTIQASLFSKLIGMLFHPEKKGPSEFTTRNIITSILFTYIESAAGPERFARAETVLSHLRDPQPPDHEKPLPFVMDMWRERPYRVWCKEATNVTKEVFWIFLHELNIIALNKPDEKTQGADDDDDADLAYMARHFPQERPPVPAAPYVGGVEWDATNYLASHLDLMNAILACTPSRDARCALRAELRISGWERCMGGSLRRCKEKFYGAVHESLRTWVAAAAEDGWDPRDVRYGPPTGSKSPTKSGGSPAKMKPVEPPPRLEMPRFDFGPKSGGSGVGAGGHDRLSWLS